MGSGTVMRHDLFGDLILTLHKLFVCLLNFLGWLLRVDLIKWVSNVCPQKVYSWVMHDGVQYDPIQGQGHEPLKVGNSAIFKGCLLPHL